MDWAQIATLASALATPVFACIGAVYVARSKNKADALAMVSAATKNLLDHNQEERQILADLASEQRSRIDNLNDRVDALLGEKRTLQSKLDALERLLERNGIPVPKA